MYDSLVHAVHPYHNPRQWLGCLLAAGVRLRVWVFIYRLGLEAVYDLILSATEETVLHYITESRGLSVHLKIAKQV